jgi:hypothetical protein
MTGVCMALASGRRSERKDALGIDHDELPRLARDDISGGLLIDGYIVASLKVGHLLIPEGEGYRHRGELFCSKACADEADAGSERL